MIYTILFSPEAEEQLLTLYDYVAHTASPDVAEKFVESIIDFCNNLQHFPERGNSRSDIRKNLRITHYKKRTIIAFSVDAKTSSVFILGIFYGGQNFETLLQAISIYYKNIQYITSK